MSCACRGDCEGVESFRRENDTVACVCWSYCGGIDCHLIHDKYHCWHPSLEVSWSQWVMHAWMLLPHLQETQIWNQFLVVANLNFSLLQSILSHLARDVWQNFILHAPFDCTVTNQQSSWSKLEPLELSLQIFSLHVSFDITFYDSIDELVESDDICWKLPWESQESKLRATQAQLFQYLASPFLGRWMTDRISCGSAKSECWLQTFERCEIRNVTACPRQTLSLYDLTSSFHSYAYAP